MFTMWTQGIAIFLLSGIVPFLHVAYCLDETGFSESCAGDAKPAQGSQLLQLQRSRARLDRTHLNSHALEAQEPHPGLEEPLTQEGYEVVANCCCEYQMEMFVRRVITEMGLQVCEEGGLLGFFPWFTCEKHTIQTLQKLKEGLLFQSQSANQTGFRCGFVTDALVDCIPMYELPEECRPWEKDPGLLPKFDDSMHRRRICHLNTSKVETPENVLEAEGDAEAAAKDAAAEKATAQAAAKEAAKEKAAAAAAEAASQRSAEAEAAAKAASERADVEESAKVAAEEKAAAAREAAERAAAEEKAAAEAAAIKAAEENAAAEAAALKAAEEKLAAEAKALKAREESVATEAAALKAAEKKVAAEAAAAKAAEERALVAAGLESGMEVSIRACTASSANLSDSVNGAVLRAKPVTSFQGHRSWNLDRTFLEYESGPRPSIGQNYTFAAWIYWRSSDTGFRTLIRFAEHSVAIKKGSDRLGILSHESGTFYDSGYKISHDTSKWQLVVVVGNGDSPTGSSGTSTFYTAAEGKSKVSFRGASDHVVSGTSWVAMGWSGQGPGKLAAVYQWNRSLALEEMNVLLTNGIGCENDNATSNTSSSSVSTTRTGTTSTTMTTTATLNKTNKTATNTNKMTTNVTTTRNRTTGMAETRTTTTTTAPITTTSMTTTTYIAKGKAKKTTATTTTIANTSTAMTETKTPTSTTAPSTTTTMTTTTRTAKSKAKKTTVTTTTLANSTTNMTETKTITTTTASITTTTMTTTTHTAKKKTKKSTATTTTAANRTTGMTETKTTTTTTASITTTTMTTTTRTAKSKTNKSTATTTFFAKRTTDMTDTKATTTTTAPINTPTKTATTRTAKSKAKKTTVTTTTLANSTTDMTEVKTITTTTAPITTTTMTATTHTARSKTKKSTATTTTLANRTTDMTETTTSTTTFASIPTSTTNMTISVKKNNTSNTTKKSNKTMIKSKSTTTTTAMANRTTEGTRVKSTTTTVPITTTAMISTTLAGTATTTKQTKTETKTKTKNKTEISSTTTAASATSTSITYMSTTPNTIMTTTMVMTTTSATINPKACEWSMHENMYSGGYAGGISTRFDSESEAQEKCMELGASTCRAVTCKDENGGTRCTVRRSSKLKKSPSWAAETTFVPTAGCFKAQSSATTATTTMIIMTTTVAGTNLKACQWSMHENMYSGGYAGGISTRFDSESEAQEKCMELGASTCRAVTCKDENGGTRCTVRRSSKLKKSPSWAAETTFVPTAGCFKAQSSATTATTTMIIMTTTVAGTNPEACQWSTHEGMFSGGYAGGVRTIFFSTAKAEKKCLELGASTCKAVTCRRVEGRIRCTVRRSSGLKKSPSWKGEITYVPNANCFQAAASTTTVTTTVTMTSTTITTTTSGQKCPRLDCPLAMRSHRHVNLQDEDGSVKLSRLGAVGKLDVWTFVDAGEGKVFIKSYRNQFLSDGQAASSVLMQDVGGTLGLTNDTGDSEKWELVDAWGGKYFIKSHRNQFLSDNWWHPTLNKASGHKEAWTIICDPDVKEMCIGPFQNCAAWGDPHYTSTFYGGHFDNYALGPFKLAADTNKSFELQGFQAPLGPWGGTGFVGFAMKIGSAHVTIVQKNVTIDGSLFTGGSHHSGLRVSKTWDSRDTVTLNTGDNCLHLTFHYLKTKVKPGFYQNVNIAMASNKVAVEGMCGSGSDQQPIQRADSLFGKSELDGLCSMAGLEDCETFSAPPSWNPVTGPRDVCERAGIPYDTAVSKCKELDAQPSHFSSCLFDYCASDGDSSMVTDAVNAGQQEEFYKNCTFQAAVYPMIGKGQCFDNNGYHESIGFSTCGSATHWGCKSLGQCKYACSCNENCGAFQFHYGHCWLYAKVAKPYVKTSSAMNSHKCYTKQILSDTPSSEGGEPTTTTTTTAKKCPELDSPVALMSFRDHYLQDNDGKLSFSKSIGVSEVWVLVDAGDDQVFIKSHRNQMLSAVDSKLKLSENKSVYEKWNMSQSYEGRFAFQSQNMWLSDNWWHPTVSGGSHHNEGWAIICDPQIEGAGDNATGVISLTVK